MFAEELSLDFCKDLTEQSEQSEQSDMFGD